MSGTDRTRILLARPDAWIEPAEKDGRYRLRLSADRRRRPAMTLDEAAFRELAREPGLALRKGGGWTARAGAVRPDPSPGGRPGVIEGVRQMMAPDGTVTSRAANLGESPILWLARRKDPSGRPWLGAAQVAAGEKLRADAELASLGPSLTMRWDALPRGGAGQGAPSGPTNRALAARRRVHEALSSMMPERRAMLERICIHGSSLRLAEQGLGLRRRQGKTLLKQALADLARHYGIG